MSEVEEIESGTETIAKQRVARILRTRILGGELRKGQSMPSERELSRELNVGRTVVRQALSMLGSEGLVASNGVRMRTVSYDTPDEQSTWISRSIALLIPSLGDGESSTTQTRWSRYLTLGLIEHLRNRNIHAITLSSQATDVADARRMASCRPMGVLVLEPGSSQFDIVGWSSVFADAGVPVVCNGGDPALEQFDRVVSDHEQGSYALTNRLIERGCRKIVQFWPKPWETYWFDARMKGHAAAMAQHGLAALPTYEFPYTAAPIDDATKFDYAVKMVAGFLLNVLREQSPDALLLSTDRDVPYVAAALRLHGLTAGKDVLLAGYDNYWPNCEEIVFEPNPPALTVDKCNQSAGSEMVQLLLDRIEERLPAARQMLKIPQVLIESASASIVDSRVV